MTFVCCDRRRLEAITLAGTKNAIDYLEVRDQLEPDPTLRQRTLFVRLLRSGFTLTSDNVLIDGGERILTIPVEWAAAADDLPDDIDPALVQGIDDPERTLVVRTAFAGDFSRYTLHLRASLTSDQPPDGFDPRLSDIEFSFKVECPSDYDCGTAPDCPPQLITKPEIDYLAKDYTGFRRLMLDRLTLLAPDWTERSAADLGVALVELMAYAADNLSYRQDAIANEAYLGTAHRRVSIRRHARLVDYALHDGCNARAWVHVQVDADCTLPRGTQLFTSIAGLPARLPPDGQEVAAAHVAGATIFETAHEVRLFSDLNALSFYTWADRGCCLPRGATRATLKYEHPYLKVGDVLVFQEEISPTKGTDADVDRAKRCAVRLTAVHPKVDPSGQLFEPDPVDGPLHVTDIEWDEADALPFPLCLSVEDFPDVEISKAKGNIVLVDHGATVRFERVGPVPSPTKLRVPSAAPCACQHAERPAIPARFRPALTRAPITHGFELEREIDLPLTADGDDWRPASALLMRDPREALPLIELDASETAPRWLPRRDLLASDGDAPHFVLEIEEDGGAVIRFGDGRHGRRPVEETVFHATYRVGNGTAGNVGAEAISHVVTTAPVAHVCNPMPAAGGVDPESVEVARRDAPEAFRRQERAVTAADYAAAAERRSDVQRAAATFRWTGSWHTVFVTVDRLGGAPADRRFEVRLRRDLERFRMAGYDLEVDGPRHLPLDVMLHICVKPEYFRSEVVRAVRVALGSGVGSDGRLGTFHPDNFSFGEAVFLSRIVAAAQAVEGVEAVQARRFQRRGTLDTTSMESGVIPMGRLEIAQLADSPNFPERGRLVIEAGGGK